MQHKSTPAGKPAATCPSGGWYPSRQPLILDEFGPNASNPNTWAITAYKEVPPTSREELLAELERMDAGILPAAEWVELIDFVPPYTSLTAVGDPTESIRDLVRLRAILPRIRTWLELGAHGSSMSNVTAQPDLHSYASRLASLIMKIDAEAWRVAACDHYRESASRCQARWQQAESDLRAELECRLRDLFLHCLTRGPHAPETFATPPERTVSGSAVSDHVDVGRADRAEARERAAESC